jgi:hypothetical protein
MTSYESGRYNPDSGALARFSGAYAEISRDPKRTIEFSGLAIRALVEFAASNSNREPKDQVPTEVLLGAMAATARIGAAYVQASGETHVPTSLPPEDIGSAPSIPEEPPPQE